MQQSSDGANDGLIYDIGAHLGEDTEFYLKLGYRVVAVEADPAHAAALRSRFAEQLGAGRLILVEGAIAPHGGMIEFHVNDVSSVFGTTQRDWVERNAAAGMPSRTISVPSIDPAELLRDYGIPHYLKVDIEGSDMLVLEALERLGGTPAFVSIEASSENRDRLRAEFDALERLGYRRFKVVRQGRHRAGLFQSRDGRTFEHKFNEHSSGPFGQVLPGRWLTRRQAERRYAAWAVYSAIFRPERPLGRFMSKIPRLRRIPLGLPWFDTHARA